MSKKRKQRIMLREALADETGKIQVPAGLVLEWDGRNYVGRNPLSGLNFILTAEQARDGIVCEYVEARLAASAK